MLRRRRRVRGRVGGGLVLIELELDESGKKARGLDQLPSTRGRKEFPSTRNRCPGHVYTTVEGVWLLYLGRSRAWYTD